MNFRYPWCIHNSYIKFNFGLPSICQAVSPNVFGNPKWFKSHTVEKLRRPLLRGAAAQWSVGFDEPPATIDIHIFLCVNMYIYVYIYYSMIISIYHYLSIYLSIYPSIHPPIYLSIYLSISWYIYNIHTYTYIYIYLYIYIHTDIIL